MRISSAVWTAIFVFAAAVQYNDPDGLYWGGLYLGAALPCAYRAADRDFWVLPAVVGLVAVSWAAALAPQVAGSIDIGQLFEAWEMNSAAIEVGREVGGLLIVAGWMLVLMVDGLRERKAPSAP